MYRGFIKVWRNILVSTFWKDLNSKQRDLALTCLLLAGHKESEWVWRGKVYKCMPGEFITSLEKLTAYCGKGVTVQNLKTNIVKLEKCHFLTNKSTKRGRLIKIMKWDTYQGEKRDTNKESNQQPQKNQPTESEISTTTKNVLLRIKEEGGKFPLPFFWK